jgi:hypothetical protein
MYGVVAGGGISSLVRIDLATGAATSVGSIGFIKVGSIEFGNDGFLYGGVADAFTSPGALIRINTTTGAGTLIGLAGGGLRITGLTACPTGASRTFVSVNGNDVGSCPATSPCRALTYAIAQTVARGEIQILDSGGYGGVTIDKSITIAAADGVYAGISVSSGTGITVDAGPSGRVALRGLTINAIGGGATGINVVSAQAVQVDDCTISGFPDAGLRALPAAASSVYVRNSKLRANNVGIVAATIASGTMTLSVEQSQFEANAIGLAITQLGAKGSVVKSRFVGNAEGALVSPSAPSPATLDIRRSVFEGGGTAIRVGASAVVTAVSSLLSHNATGIDTEANGTSYVSDCTITRNGTGLQGSGAAISLQDNRLLGNTTNGAFTSMQGKS